MRVFISWSGRRSKALAQALHGWLPRVLPLIQPWTSENIPPGSTWRAKLIGELKELRAAIVCLTPENLRAQWLNFEAGAAVGTSAAAERLFPIFLGNEPVAGPFEGLQIVRCTEEGIKRLVRELNALSETPLPDAWLEAQVHLLWKDLEDLIEDARIQVPDSSWEVYDDAIKNIRSFLNELERKKKVNVITFYVRDYAAPRDAIDFYIEENIGLSDPAPIFGPIVFDDFRKREFAESDRFNEDMTAQWKVASEETIAGRATTFVGREGIRASATFSHFDELDSGVKALLNLNWREVQTFSEERKRQLRADAATVFSLLPTRPAISLKRSRLLTKELRARRFLGAAGGNGTSPVEQCERIRKSLAQFFEPDSKDVDIEVIYLEEDHAVKWRNDTQHGIKCAAEPNWTWVQMTTKPLFLKSATERSSIIVPMRIPPGLNSCKGVIAIKERASGFGTLESDMVRPLCSLADTFGGMPGTHE